MWQRIFLAEALPVDAEELLESVRAAGFRIAAQFRRDEQGWFEGLLVEEDSEAAVEIRRYLAGEDGIRQELNGWAAWVEEILPEEEATPWLIRFIGAKEVVTLRCLEEGDPEAAAPLMDCLARSVAAAGGGFRQVDGVGLLDAAGNLLVREQEFPRP